MNKWEEAKANIVVNDDYCVEWDRVKPLIQAAKEEINGKDDKISCLLHDLEETEKEIARLREELKEAKWWIAQSQDCEIKPEVEIPLYNEKSIDKT